jgi:hypothetical protein
MFRLGLGLMIGEGEPPGVSIGQTGGGPGSIAAIYRQGRGGPRTVAGFVPLDDSGGWHRAAEL